MGIIIPTDFHIFQRGRSTTNQMRIVLDGHKSYQPRGLCDDCSDQPTSKGSLCPAETFFLVKLMPAPNLGWNPGWAWFMFGFTTLPLNKIDKANHTLWQVRVRCWSTWCWPTELGKLRQKYPTWHPKTMKNLSAIRNRGHFQLFTGGLERHWSLHWGIQGQGPPWGIGALGSSSVNHKLQDIWLVVWNIFHFSIYWE